MSVMHRVITTSLRRLLRTKGFENISFCHLLLLNAYNSVCMIHRKVITQLKSVVCYSTHTFLHEAV